MTLQPLYTLDRLSPPAYYLHYAWTGWPTMPERFPEPSGDLWTIVDPQWESDGIRRLEVNWSESQIQITGSVRPEVSPVFFTSRIKARLQVALRKLGKRVDFSRKVGFRTIGANRRVEIEQYIANQVDQERFADPNFANFFRQFTFDDPQVRLETPNVTNSGRYWYNLHLVLVTEKRQRFYDFETLNQISRSCLALSKENMHWIKTRSLLPDHLHMAMRGDVESSPQDIALYYLNQLADAVGRKAIWQPSFYVGSFGEYDMGAVRIGSSPIDSIRYCVRDEKEGG